MLGAAPPAPPARAARLGETALEVRGLSLPSVDELGVALKDIGLSAEERRRSSASRASRATGRPSCWPRCRARTGVRPPAASASTAATWRPRRRGRAARWGFTSSPRSASAAASVPALSLAANTLLTRREPVGKGGLAAPRPRAAAGRQPHRALRRAARGGPRRWRGACRAATCRSSSSAARSTPPPRCWSWRSRPGASTSAPPRRSAARSPRSATPGARALVVSEDLDELFEICYRPGGDRARPAVAADRGARRQPGADRSVDERPVPRRRRPSRPR